MTTDQRVPSIPGNPTSTDAAITANEATCCGPQEQATCCAPAQKSSCCSAAATTGGSCGCR
jgi:hypothetical protein